MRNSRNQKNTGKPNASVKKNLSDMFRDRKLPGVLKENKIRQLAEYRLIRIIQ